MEKEVIAWNPPVEWVKEAIENAGTKIGSVHFNKRSNGELRKMCYRLHVQNPSVATVPKGTKVERECLICGCKDDKCTVGPYRTVMSDTRTRSKKDIDISNDQITVLDANKVVRDRDGNKIGRGAWRTVPLENVTRISNNGTVYTIKRT